MGILKRGVVKIQELLRYGTCQNSQYSRVGFHVTCRDAASIHHIFDGAPADAGLNASLIINRIDFRLPSFVVES